MKEFMSSIIAIILVSFVLEVFVVNKHIKKTVISAFMVVMSIILFSGVVNLFHKNKISGDRFEESLRNSMKTLSDAEVKHTQTSLLSLLQAEKVGEVMDLSIEYETEGYQVNYKSVEVQVNGEVQEDKILEIVMKTLKGIQEEDIEIV